MVLLNIVSDSNLGWALLSTFSWEVFRKTIHAFNYIVWIHNVGGTNVSSLHCNSIDYKMLSRRLLASSNINI